MRLCDICSEFDVGALLSAAEAAPSRPNTNRVGNLVSSEKGVVREGITQFFKHQPNLTCLRASSEDCDLCAAIWQQYQAQRSALELTDAVLAQGLGNEQLYLGTQQWDTGLNSVPHLIAVQQGRPSRITRRRELACFEVCIPHGMLSFHTSFKCFWTIYRQSSAQVWPSLMKTAGKVCFG